MKRNICLKFIALAGLAAFSFGFYLAAIPTVAALGILSITDKDGAK